MSATWARRVDLPLQLSRASPQLQDRPAAVPSPASRKRAVRSQAVCLQMFANMGEEGVLAVAAPLDQS